MRAYWQLIGLACIATALTGCFTFGDLDAVKPGDDTGATDLGTQDTASMGSESDTGSADTGTGTGTGSDTGTVDTGDTGDTGSVDTGTGSSTADSGSSDTDTGTGDSGSATTADTGSDTGSDTGDTGSADTGDTSSATVVDTGTTDSATESTSATSDTGSDSGSDTGSETFEDTTTYATDGQGCDFDTECAPGLGCNQQLCCLQGANCCLGDTACGGFVCDTDFTCAPSCSGDQTDCATGYYCEGDTACLPTLGNGETCDRDGMCTSARCAVSEGGFCAVANGAPACHDDGGCADGLTCDLSSFTCFATCDNGGAPDDSRCQAGFYCSATACAVDVADGASCGRDAECQGNRCGAANHVCCSSGDCCGADTQCGAYTCDTLSTHACRTACDGPGLSGCNSGFFCAGTTCLPLKTDSDGCAQSYECGSGNCNNDLCCAFGRTCCADSLDCPTLNPLCNDDAACMGCDETTDATCETEHPSTPQCLASTGACVECLAHTDCRVAPFNSPVGACTPDNTCTCWVPGDARESCLSDDDCAPLNAAFGAAFYCAQDTSLAAHFVCLRSCGSTFLNPVSGMKCSQAVDLGVEPDPYVWLPVTSCFAYSKVGSDCLANRDCGIKQSAPYDGSCPNDICTYSCLDGATADDTWCASGDCGIQYCVP